MRKLLLVASLMVMFVPQANAKTKDGETLKTIFTKCGIGAEIFDDEPILAAVANFVLPYSSLSATSSYYSSDNRCNSTKKVALLVAGGYDKLELEIMNGKGKYIDTLSELSGKSRSDIRREFSAVVSSDRYSSMSKSAKVEKLFSIVAQ